jgi:dihydroorotase
MFVKTFDHASQLREIESFEKEVINKINTLPCTDHTLQLKKIESLEKIASSTNDIVVEMSQTNR